MIKYLFTLSALLLTALLAACSPAAETPEAATAVPAASGANTAVAEAFVTDLVAGRFDTAVAGFDQTMTEAMPSAALADTWAQLLGQAGRLRRRARARARRAKAAMTSSM